MTSAPATTAPSESARPGDLRQHRVPEGVLAHEPLRGSERLEVVRVVGLELVDDHVPHADRPAAERDEEERHERQEPVVEQVEDEGQRPAAVAVGS